MRTSSSLLLLGLTLLLLSLLTLTASHITTLDSLSMKTSLAAPFAILFTALTFLSRAQSAQRAAANIEDVRFQAMLANIGGATKPTLVPGVLDGSVIASPSTSQPDYFYSWVRDSAMTFKLVIDAYLKGTHGVTRDLIQRWIASEITHQRNAQGSSESLGEPKFNVDGSLFTGPWGRPQNDGPAIRATAMMAFARKIGLNDAYVTQTLYKPDLSAGSPIKSDLEYVAHHWNVTSFDLWEEQRATHFFTLIVQQRALAEGSAFATALKDPLAATYYAQQAKLISNLLQSFYSTSLGRVQAYLNLPTRRAGLDCSTLLGSLHAWNQSSPKTGTEPELFGPASDRMLATHKQYVDAFRELYPINAKAQAPAAVGVGRYPEDTYNGVTTSGQGNPWFLCTSAASELLSSALHIFTLSSSLTITSTSHSFFAQFAPDVKEGTYKRSSETYTKLTEGMRTMVRGFDGIIEKHAFQNASLAEQFDRNDGFSRGARDLTWSYAAWLSANEAAKGTPVF